ncbi:OLC1v1000538C1 [Oldenlandia corymbosa var. corymbosa]|uniref:OLC1v1000538C1 n=1 Tax=Oldenlandia corymbosa var. corymbosa TaxID=529605 RepID=A0AAV1D364_OLDCO|nr:OLC1v1000538C1 [Oldenlandia corymbosa var. corymbosa]
MAETNQTAIPVVEPKGSVETVNENAVNNPIVIPSEDVIVIPPNQKKKKMPVVEPSDTVETVNENAVNNSVVNPFEDIIAAPPNDVGATIDVIIYLYAKATIPGKIVKDSANSFKEGCVRKLSRFDSCLNISVGFRCAKHEYKIVFMSNTNVEAAFDFDIPDHVFEFTPLAEVTNFVANFDYCFGHIMTYSDPIVENGKKRISVELEDERSSAHEMKAASVHKISMLLSISGYTSYENFINGAKLLSLGDIDDLDEEIDSEMCAEFYQNLTSTEDSTAKTAVSCTGDIEIGNLGNDMTDSPPPKNKHAGSCGEESIKSNLNKCVRKL